MARGISVILFHDTFQSSSCVCVSWKIYVCGVHVGRAAATGWERQAGDGEQKPARRARTSLTQEVRFSIFSGVSEVSLFYIVVLSSLYNNEHTQQYVCINLPQFCLYHCVTVTKHTCTLVKQYNVTVKLRLFFTLTFSYISLNLKHMPM